MKKVSNPLIPSRVPKRAHLDTQTIYQILDEALFCNISYCIDGLPYSIPTSFVRYGDKIYIHGSVGSHFIRTLEGGLSVCISVMLADSLVVAKSALSHSVNYRSVVIFAAAEAIIDPQLKLDSFEWLIDKIIPGSWSYLRPLTESEIKRTAVLAFDLSKSSAKIREGMPNDEAEDKALPIWSGIIPLQNSKMSPIADETSQQIPLPAHLVA